MYRYLFLTHAQPLRKEIHLYVLYSVSLSAMDEWAFYHTGDAFHISLFSVLRRLSNIQPLTDCDY